MSSKTSYRKRYRFGSKRRDSLWYGAVWQAHATGQGVDPICNLCGTPVRPTDPWDESHVGAPKALGGRRVGVAHRVCNRADNATRVTPMVARAKRLAAIVAGRKGPGLGRHPMPGGRFSTVTKTMRHGAQPRLARYGKHARMLERLAIAPETQP